MASKGDETPKPEGKEITQSPFRIRDKLPLVDRLFHAHRRLMFGEKLQLGYFLVKAGGIEDPSGYIDEAYI